MRFGDKLEVLVTENNGRDVNFDPIPPTNEWKSFGKCIIMPNSSAQSVSLVDGKEYIYQYQIYAPLKSSHYKDGLIPKEGMKIRITKEDGTIEKEAFVKGFLTLRKRYVKIWV